MKIAVIGTGIVGRTIAGKLNELGHSVVVGTRNVERTLENDEPNPYGMPAFREWLAQNPGVRLGTFAEAAAHGELVINAASGMGAIEALRAAEEENLSGKIVMDISNPLDFSRGMPPTLSVCNDDSLGEQIQHDNPQAKVVKTLNTVTAALMVDPRALADGEHDVFVCGDDPAAKAQVSDYLKSWFGWKHVIDLGDITTARGAEMYLPLWLRLWGALGTGMINVHVAR